MRTASDAGITHFDTAEGYMRGRSEETVGRALVGLRNQVTVTTKVTAASDDRADKLMRRLEESLRRLRTDRVDFISIMP